MSPQLTQTADSHPRRKSKAARSAKRLDRSRSEARFVRNPDLLICWDRDRLLLKDLESGTNASASAEIISLLDFFSRPRTVAGAVRSLQEYAPGAVLGAIRRLLRLGLLLPEREAMRRKSRLEVWGKNLASAHYHVASRNMSYIQSPAEIWKHLETRVASRRRPAKFKRYESRFRESLKSKESETVSRGFEEVLSSRRTVRRFSLEPVRFEDLAAVISGTWGRTGWIQGQLLGRFATKSSPSAGALHPIECYVLAWNVQRLRAGLYHYDVGANELRKLRFGDFRKTAIQAASGQRWVGGAAFLCILTAVFTRSLWKYELETAYRDIWLDAGHLAQTFCLLATARGLGPFTTVAIQDSYIEKLIGLDGIKEFPVYLCGAGVPADPLLPSSD